jgi:PPK2 family polyphosphate:nucleotide phosphotransferase
MARQELTVKPGKPIRLRDFDPGHAPGDKQSGLRKTAAHVAATGELQYRLYAENRRSLLVVLQGMDAAGKDGTVRHVMQGLNPLSCFVAAFKQPTAEELSHDFLWRIHARVPRSGQIGVFNRSHYEDVVTARVHKLVPRRVWQERYAAINDFERHLSESGTRILKFFLHISKLEQKRRLQARLDDPAKRWKFTEADIAERKHWSSYQTAYQDALTECNTSGAPWHIVPADRKWYRNLVISRAIQSALEEMDPRFPPPELGNEDLVVR